MSLANAIPFIGFGFLDNFIMIIAVSIACGTFSEDFKCRFINICLIWQGDSIETGMSAYITLSTMAAAALGNTFSDVIGVGSAYYVERVASLVGLGAPKLSPVQLDMTISRRFSNLVCMNLAITSRTYRKLENNTIYIHILILGSRCRYHSGLHSGNDAIALHGWRFKIWTEKRRADIEKENKHIKLLLIGLYFVLPSNYVVTKLRKN